MRRVFVTVLVASLLVVATAALPASAVPPPEYRSRITRLPDGIREWMNGISWRPGCPVPLRDLRLIRLRYWGFDRRAHAGRLVVHADVAKTIAGVFGRLYEVSFPIRQMRLVDAYGADDRTSMAHDNTSAFNCRWRAGQPGVWSQHAYGRAIDVDPVENPYVWSGGVSPWNGAPYVDRRDRRRGMIFRGDAVWWAFRNRGWEWGGDWSSVKDYQHFSRNGR
ncbi:MAG: M15 family metallopeptidase [Actinomycetota bacterium]